MGTGGPAAQCLHDALVLPRAREVLARYGDARALTDRGRVVGIDLAPLTTEPALLWEAATALWTVARDTVGGLRWDDGVERALMSAIAATTRTRHGLGDLAAACSGGAGGRVGVAELTARLLQDARTEPTVPRVVLTVAHPQPCVPASSPAGMPLRIPRGVRPAARLEVESPHADLAYVRLCRAVPAVSTVRELAAVLIANQAWFGPYHSVVDGLIRFQEGVSYLWDCVLDLVRGEFAMLAAPDPADVDHVISVVRAAHAAPGPLSPERVGTARRVVRTRILRRLGTAEHVLPLQSEAQRAGLPPSFVASLLAALREVTDVEAALALPAVAAEPVSVTVIVPAVR
ncbi:hypothetical protein [Nonomuraea sp. NPDC050643]|uniref:hypothetical protein n=1 Tax=Nonomuraea sp. NPDC050643 TaxID=3155660 RepID=UPI0033F3E7E3